MVQKRAQTRDKKVLIRIEPIVYEAMTKIVGSGSSSEYFRNLAIEDLKQRGLLTEKMIAEYMA